ncbi:MAG: Hsp20/alpha crystallin family protein [Deltaproteobacteria bacterium]|nr:Hsp20/alpha crystallin family protein [Candidatus Tharpella sp.]
MSKRKDETFDMLFSMKNKMDRFFAASEPEASPFGLQPGSHWSPAVDLFDFGYQYRIMVEVPGIEKEQIELSVYADRVVVKGRREESFDVSGKTEVLCLERVYGRFERVILLPDPVDAEQVKAVLKNGVLTILLTRKSVEVGKKNITIE